jgi:ankyrin repeat protein
MGFWKTLLGSSRGVAAPVAKQPSPAASTPATNIPDGCFDTPPADNDAFIARFKDCLPTLFKQVSGRSPDTIVMLIAFDQEKWRALVALLQKQPNRIFLSPETYSQGKAKLENNGYCDVYVPPTLNGKTLKAGLYVLEREYLFSQLCWMKGLPPPFLSMVKDEKKAGHFTVAVLNSNGMCVRHLPFLNSQQVVSTPTTQATPAAGAGISAKTKHEGAALLEAAEKGDTIRVKALIKAGADVSARDGQGATALMWAASKCDVDTVRSLIAAGADLSAKSKWDSNALDWAASAGSVDNVQALIAAGADVNAKGMGGGTALHSVAGNYGFEFYSKINAFNATIEALIAAGADVNAKNESGNTAIMWAANKRKGLQQVKMLIAAGADVNARDKEGKNVLMYASKSDPEISEALKTAGASLSPSEEAMLLNQPPEEKEARFDIPRLTTSASALTARLSEGMSIEDVHKAFGEPHHKNRYSLLRCDYHEVWISVDGRLRVFYSPSKTVAKWAVES